MLREEEFPIERRSPFALAMTVERERERRGEEGEVGRKGRKGRRDVVVVVVVVSSIDGVVVVVSSVDGGDDDADVDNGFGRDSDDRTHFLRSENDEGFRGVVTPPPRVEVRIVSEGMGGGSPPFVAAKAGSVFFFEIQKKNSF